MPANTHNERREGRVSVTLPRLLRERLRATLEQRSWIDAHGKPERGAEGEVVGEWLAEYVRLKGWDQVGATNDPAPAERSGPTVQQPTAEQQEDDDFGFTE